MHKEPTDLRIYSTLDDNLQQALTRLSIERGSIPTFL